MAKWKAGNYMNSGMSKSQYLSKSKSKSSGKSNTSKVSSDFIGPLAPNQTRTATPSTVPSDFIGPLAPGQSRETASKASSKKSSKVNTNQRSLADVARNNPYGVNESAVKNTGGVSLVPTKTRNNTVGNIFKGAVNTAKTFSPAIGSIAKLINYSGVDVSNLLGIDKALASDSGLATYQSDKGEILGDYSERIDEPSTPDQVIQLGRGPIQYPGVTDSPTKSSGSKGNQEPKRKSQPVSNPWVNPYQQVTESLPKSSMYSPQSTPNYSDVRQNERTVRGMGGQGLFSKGEFSNGQGGYGFQGTMGAEGGNSEQDLINQLLGVDPEMNDETAYPGLSFTNGNPQAGAEMLRQLNTAPQILQTTQNETPQANYGTRGMGGAQVKVAGNKNIDDYGYDDQIKQQEKSYKEQQKAQEKALNELLKSIESQYQTSETETRDVLGKQNQEDLLKLAGLFSFANQDPNSEQRMQYQQRANTDYNTQLANAMAKLGASRAGDISGAKQNYQSQISSLAERRAQAIQAIQKEQRQYQQKMQEMQMKAQPKASTKVASAKKPGRAEIFDWVNEAISQGGDWEEIAQQAEANGIDTHTGSYLDQLLRQANKQGRWQ